MYSEFSRKLSWSLDKCGYSAHQRQVRRFLYSELDKVGSAMIPNGLSREVTVGSKGEGLTKPFESDRDTLYLSNFINCVDEELLNCIWFRPNPGIMTLKCRTSDCSPGHVLMMEYDVNGEGMAPENGDFVSSDAFLNGFTQQFAELNNNPNTMESLLTVHNRAGPSLPTSFGLVEADNVFSIPYTCHCLWQEWNSRKRLPGGWPSPELRQQVIQLGANLVPIGSGIGSYGKHEWRICFNQGETLLVSSWNDCQTKLYILLKMILKNVMKLEGKTLTSYVMKNIVFWLAEVYPQTEFTEDNLYGWIVRALNLLKDKLIVGNVPYYMIPDRNLLAGKNDPDQMQAAITQIDLVITAGPPALLICPKLYEAMVVMTPDQLNNFEKLRDELEKVAIIETIREAELLHADPSAWEYVLRISTDPVVISAARKMLEIISRDWINQSLVHGDIFSNYALQIVKRVLS